ncbi:MAG TPA: alkaline phosphatase family protein [Candidatus Nitrosotalea sp.]|nr:alkaline phosphatase family protein [Candidatus Nitrosotalea sp.]
MKRSGRGIYVGAMAFALLLDACGSESGARALVSAQNPAVSHAGNPSSPITHVVVVVQENRSVDNLFQFLPGADTARYGLNLYGGQVQLKAIGLKAKYDIQHAHADWLSAYNNGGMNGWSKEVCTGSCRRNFAYGYVPEAEVEPYYQMAESYTFGDEMFQSSQGPSFPAHQYIVSGTSTNRNNSYWRVSEDTGNNDGGCDSPPGTTARMINPAGREGRPVFPCFDRTSIFDLLDAAGVSWHFYQANNGPGPWNAVDALKPVWQNQQEYSSNVTTPPSKVLSDVISHNLASVVFVVPTAAESDHAGHNKGTGPSWVASIVNTIGSSSYWKSTAIIVIWDDWGGWYDHVTPAILNSYELGFRVPMIVISPYAKAAYVSHVQYEFGSILKFIEETFNLASLGTTDLRANDLSDCFNLGLPARNFKRIAAPYSTQYFLREPASHEPPDY